MGRTKYIGKKKGGKVKYLVFGKYKLKPVNSVPRHYLYWMLENLDLSIWEQSVIDAVLYSKTERLIQKQVVEEMKWLK